MAFDRIRKRSFEDAVEAVLRKLNFDLTRYNLCLSAGVASVHSPFLDVEIQEGGAVVRPQNLKYIAVFGAKWLLDLLSSTWFWLRDRPEPFRENVLVCHVEGRGSGARYMGMHVPVATVRDDWTFIYIANRTLPTLPGRQDIRAYVKPWEQIVALGKAIGAWRLISKEVNARPELYDRRLYYKLVLMFSLEMFSRFSRVSNRLLGSKACTVFVVSEYSRQPSAFIHAARSASLSVVGVSHGEIDADHYGYQSEKFSAENSLETFLALSREHAANVCKMNPHMVDRVGVISPPEAIAKSDGRAFTLQDQLCYISSSEAAAYAEEIIMELASWAKPRGWAVKFCRHPRDRRALKIPDAARGVVEFVSGRTFEVAMESKVAVYSWSTLALVLCQMGHKGLHQLHTKSQYQWIDVAPQEGVRRIERANDIRIPEQDSVRVLPAVQDSVDTILNNLRIAAAAVLDRRGPGSP